MSSAQVEALGLETRASIEAINRKFADAQDEFADGLAAHKLVHRRDEAITRFDFADVIPLFTRACVMRGIVPPVKLAENIEFVETMLRHIPSKWVVREMRRVRHQNRQQRWTANDLNDVNALSGAVVYCDVVVTERQWARHLNQTGLADEHHTTVTHDLRELPEVLATASTRP